MVYNPSSHFNIMSFGRFGQHFGSTDSPYNNYEEGTWVKSCASYTNFTWDRGRFIRWFSHSSDGLPELSVNIDSSEFSTFYSKLRKIYNDKVHFYFDTAVEYENDDIESNVEDSGDNIDGEEDLKLGWMYNANVEMYKTRQLSTSTLWK